VLQISRLPDHAREVRDRLFVDGRRLSLSRLPDFRQVAAAQDCQEAGRHAASKRRPERQANRPIGWARNQSAPLPIADVDKSAGDSCAITPYLWVDEER
jgi:hypothetical protein